MHYTIVFSPLFGSSPVTQLNILCLACHLHLFYNGRAAAIREVPWWRGTFGATHWPPSPGFFVRGKFNDIEQTSLL